MLEGRLRGVRVCFVRCALALRIVGLAVRREHGRAAIDRACAGHPVRDIPILGEILQILEVFDRRVRVLVDVVHADPRRRADDRHAVLRHGRRGLCGCAQRFHAFELRLDLRAMLHEDVA
jgi:hypothetical protein